MAEDLAINGPVSNILGFIEFGVTLVSVTQSLRDARKVPDISELGIILDDIELRHAGLLQHKQSLSNADTVLLKMVQNCDKIADQLRDLSKKLSKRPEARSRTAEKFRVAINFMANDVVRHIRGLSERLEVQYTGAVQLMLPKMPTANDIGLRVIIPESGGLDRWLSRKQCHVLENRACWLARPAVPKYFRCIPREAHCS